MFYAGYFILLSYYKSKASSNQRKSKFIYPNVSFLIPVYNEEKTVERKIQNIEEIDYPSNKIEIIFIDGRSTDRTREIIAERSKFANKTIKLIQQEKRDGYSKAVSLGILKSNGEIIIATDGASFHYPDAILHLVKHFANSEIGAVTGKEIVMGKECNIGPQLEKSYRVFYDFMRQAETEIDSTPDSKGEILAVRREICNTIISRLNLSPNASFDSCVPYQAKLMGYRTVYDQDAKYYECAPSSFSDRMKQQVRRATLLVGAMLLYKNMILSKKAGKFGQIILPIHFVMYLLLPTIFMIGVFSLIFSTLFNPFTAVIIFWIIAFLLLVANKKTRAFLISFVQSQLALIIALFRLAQRRESLVIETIASTRENV